jgi:hypothetical protein
MNGLAEVFVQFGTMVLSVSLGLLIVWGSVAGFFRVLASPNQAQGVQRCHLSQPRRPPSAASIPFGE